MALFRDNDGKTEKATPGKLSQAANKGQVAISKELTMSVSLLIAIITLAVFGDYLFGALRTVLRDGLTVTPEKHHLVSQGGLQGGILELQQAISTVGIPLLTFMLLFFFATAFAGYAQIGFKFRPGALRWRLQALDVTKNLGRLFSFQSVARTFVSALKLIVLGSVLYFVLRSRIGQFMGLYHADDLGAALRLIIDTAILTVLSIVIVILVISIIDLIYQKWDYAESMKMSKQEVEDERKRSDGDPFIKNRLKQARNELLRQRMMESVPQADVIITNPTHYAIALAYDRKRNAAPEVVAKGVDEVALRIREIAEENDVPRVEDPPLARALFRAVKVGHEIPEKFYQAVATILGHVLRTRTEGSAA